jgi:hypothetical protein
VPVDTTEFLILDLSGGIPVAGSLAAAEVLPASQTSRFSTLSYSRFVVTIDLTAAGAATLLYMGVRTSGQANPLVSAVSNWSYYAIDDITPSTGVSNTPPYQIDIPFPSNPVRRYTRSFRVWGSWASAVIWANGAGATGLVYAQRFPLGS